MRADDHADDEDDEDDRIRRGDVQEWPQEALLHMHYTAAAAARQGSGGGGGEYPGYGLPPLHYVINIVPIIHFFHNLQLHRSPQQQQQQQLLLLLMQHYQNYHHVSHQELNRAYLNLVVVVVVGERGDMTGRTDFHYDETVSDGEKVRRKE